MYSAGNDWLSEAESVSWGMSLVTKCCLKCSPLTSPCNTYWHVVVTDHSTWEFLYMHLYKYLYLYTALWCEQEIWYTHPQSHPTPPLRVWNYCSLSRGVEHHSLCQNISFTSTFSIPVHGHYLSRNFCSWILVWLLWFHDRDLSCSHPCTCIAISNTQYQIHSYIIKLPPH